MDRELNYIPSDHNIRTEFYNLTCKTIAYPSTGGIVLGFFSAVELVSLNIPRTHSVNRSSDPADEDKLAVSMLRFGALWWPSWEFYVHHTLRLSQDIPYDFHYPPTIEVGYPSSGGAWVFKYSADQGVWDEEDERIPYLQQKPDNWGGRMNMVLTMDERCEALKEFGATFFENIELCDDLTTTLEQAIQKGRKFEELMTRMDDPWYLDKWLG